jgi:hypothetical protein
MEAATAFDANDNARRRVNPEKEAALLLEKSKVHQGESYADAARIGEAREVLEVLGPVAEIQVTTKDTGSQVTTKVTSKDVQVTTRVEKENTKPELHTAKKATQTVVKETIAVPKRDAGVLVHPDVHVAKKGTQTTQKEAPAPAAASKQPVTAKRDMGTFATRPTAMATASTSTEEQVHETIEQGREKTHDAIDATAQTIEVAASSVHKAADALAETAHKVTSVLSNPEPKAEEAAEEASVHAHLAKNKLGDTASAAKDAAYHVGMAAEEGALWALQKSNAVIQESLSMAKESVKGIASWVEDTAERTLDKVRVQTAEMETPEYHRKVEELARIGHEKLSDRTELEAPRTTVVREVNPLERPIELPERSVLRSEPLPSATSSIYDSAVDRRSMVERAVDRVKEIFAHPSPSLTVPTPPEVRTSAGSTAPHNATFDSIGSSMDDFFESGRLLGDETIRRIRNTLRSFRGSIDMDLEQQERELGGLQRDMNLKHRDIRVELPPGHERVTVTETFEPVVPTRPPVSRGLEDADATYYRTPITAPVTTSTAAPTVPPLRDDVREVPAVPRVERRDVRVEMHGAHEPVDSGLVVTEPAPAAVVIPSTPEEIVSLMNVQERREFADAYKRRLDDAFEDIKASMGITESDILNDRIPPTVTEEDMRTLQRIGHYFAEAKDHVDHAVLR